MSNNKQVRRTKERLRLALLELLRHHDFKDISVQAILDQADVSRSTFYAHFHDKDDLLMMGMPANVLHYDTYDGHDLIPPVTELFRHMLQGREWLQSMYGTSAMLTLNAKSRQLMIENWRDHLTRTSAGSMSLVEIDAAAHFLTGALMSLLLWWIQNKMPQSPEEMNDLFNKLALTGLRSF